MWCRQLRRMWEDTGVLCTGGPAGGHRVQDGLLLLGDCAHESMRASKSQHKAEEDPRRLQILRVIVCMHSKGSTKKPNARMCTRTVAQLGKPKTKALGEKSVDTTNRRHYQVHM